MTQKWRSLSGVGHVSEQCIGESRIDRSLTRPPFQNPNEHFTAPEDAMKFDLVPEFPPCGGYENIVTAMDLFSR